MAVHGIEVQLVAKAGFAVMVKITKHTGRCIKKSRCDEAGDSTVSLHGDGDHNKFRQLVRRRGLQRLMKARGHAFVLNVPARRQCLRKAGVG
eukprot:6180666-Pleurochrysis_carterae.AAC.3